MKAYISKSTDTRKFEENKDCEFCGGMGRKGSGCKILTEMLCVTRGRCKFARPRQVKRDAV